MYLNIDAKVNYNTETCLIIISLNLAMNEFILVRRQGNEASVRDVYMIPLNESGTSQAIKVVDLDDNANSGGIIFDGIRRSILYSVSGVIYSKSIDDDTESTLADLCKYFFKIIGTIVC